MRQTIEQTRIAMNRDEGGRTARKDDQAFVVRHSRRLDRSQLRKMRIRSKSESRVSLTCPDRKRGQKDEPSSSSISSRFDPSSGTVVQLGTLPYPRSSQACCLLCQPR
jgi:hypothetical protein